MRAPTMNAGLLAVSTAFKITDNDKMPAKGTQLTQQLCLNIFHKRYQRQRLPPSPHMTPWTGYNCEFRL